MSKFFHEKIIFLASSPPQFPHPAMLRELQGPGTGEMWGADAVSWDGRGDESYLTPITS